MKQRLLVVFSIILIAVFATAQQRTVVVEEPRKSYGGGNKWAVLVGVNGYKDPQIGNLKYAVNDAQNLYELLIDPSYGGFEEDKVRLLTDDTVDKPTRKNILITLNGLENARSDDTIFIFFSGHGIERDGVSYFLPINADMSILADSAISMERFQQPMDRTKAKIQVMFFDACHSGTDSAASKGFRAMGKNMHDLIHKHAKGRAILSSCGLNEMAWEHDEQKNGVFTYFLLEALKGAADTNGDGMVSVTEASNYTTDKVMTWAFKRGKEQSPQRNVSVTGEIILTASREGERLAELEKEREAIEAELAQIQEERRRAEQENDATSLAEAKRREAELAEKVRQAKLAEEAERIREQEAKRQREDAERRRREQAKIDADKREKARREQSEIERIQRELEQARKEREAAKTKTLAGALGKAREIQDQIDAVRPDVKEEIEEQISAVPKPQKVTIKPKGEFEKQTDYEARVQKAKQQETEAKRRYEQEIERIRSKLDSEVVARKKGYEDALELLERDFVLDETQVIFDIGQYDAERETFPNAVIRPKEGSTFSDFSWDFVVPIEQASQLKKSVLERVVKLRVYVHLDANRAEAKIAKVLIEDLVQEKQFWEPSPRINVNSEPPGATVRIDGQEVGKTPYEGKVSSGKHEVKLVAGQIYNPIPSRTVTVNIGDQETLSFTLTRNSKICPKDGTKMLYIPAGTFMMGSNDDNDDEKPVHEVYTDAFYMDEHEVTVGQYSKFIKATGHKAWSYVSEYSPTDKHPIIYVSWNDAQAYCKWAGKRLPTEAEWEKAARGGLVGKKYPWGNRASQDNANYYGTDGRDRWKHNAPVGSFPPNRYGLYDMAGNVFEWCSDWYSSNYYSNSTRENPYGPSTGETRVLRGGSWNHDDSSMRAAYRNYYAPTSRHYYNGFRCCVSQDITP